MAAYHLVARARGKAPLLDDPALASRVWSGLRRGFSRALMTTLMRDHVHVIGDGDDPDVMRRRMARALAGATWGRGRGLWDPVPPPDLIREPKLARAVRYVALNPCRKGLVGDPLEWLWSSYRDLLGAAMDPWIDGNRLASRLGWDFEGFQARFHRYVSADHTVSRDGTQLPVPAPPEAMPVRGLDSLVLAVASALRCPPDAVRKRGPARSMFLALAVSQGWRDPRVLSEVCGITPRQVRSVLAGSVRIRGV